MKTTTILSESAWQRLFQMYYQYKILTFVSSSNNRKPKDLQLWLYYRYLLTFKNVHSIWYASIKLTGSIIVFIIVCPFEISKKKQAVEDLLKT
jgi:hypothetical protein